MRVKSVDHSYACKGDSESEFLMEHDNEVMSDAGAT